MACVKPCFYRLLSVTSIACGLMLPQFALGQDVVLPGSTDPGRVMEDNRPRIVPDETLEREAPRKAAVPLVPEGMENLKFVLRNLSFEGLTAYEPAEISQEYKQYIGKEISVATLFGIMGKVQQKYLDDGYALTKVVIPNQNIEDGNVRLSVIEGHVSQVSLDPQILPSPVIDDAAARIAAMRPLNVKKLERIMLIVNDLPDANISAVLSSDKDPTRQGTGAVNLYLQRNPAKTKTASIGMDNYGSKFTGPWQGKSTGHLYHVGTNYSELGASVMSAVPIDEQKSGALSYSMPVLGASGTKLNLSSSRTHTEPGSSLSVLDIKGVSQSYDASVSYPIIRQRNMTLRADAGFEIKDSRTKVIGAELYDDRLRIVRAGFNFNATDSWNGYNVLDVHYAQGLNMFGVREAGSVDLSREEGRPDFKKIEMLAGRIQALPGNFELYGLLSGQYAYDALLSAEEFGFGGGQIGRGYDSSEITGDHGIAASLEFRYNTTVPAFNTVLALQPYMFYDIGKVWNIDPSSKETVSAASAGAGVRMSLSSGWSADLNLAIPLTRSADNEPKYQNDLGARVLFSLSKTF